MSIGVVYAMRLTRYASMSDVPRGLATALTGLGTVDILRQGVPSLAPQVIRCRWAAEQRL
jgi:hypothetical protein